MNGLQLFESSEFGALEVLEIEGKPYFPASQCAKILGYVEPQKAVRTHCKGVSKMDTPTPGGMQTINYIPEGDLYRLIIRSRLPAAERFECWVFDTVLPELRSKGQYGSTYKLEDIIQKTAAAVVTEVVQQLIPVLTQSVKAPLVQTIADLDYTPHREYPDERAARKRRSIMGKVERLPGDLQQAVYEMLEEGKTYLSITNFLAENGYSVSQMAIQRFYRKTF